MRAKGWAAPTMPETSVRQPITLTGYCSTERAVYEHFAYLQTAAQRVLEILDRRLGRRGIRIEWQAVPDQCNVWLYFTEVSAGDEVSRLFVPFSGYARVAADMALVAGQAPPSWFAHEGRSGGGFLRNSDDYVLRRSARRLAARIAKSVRQWVADHHPAPGPHQAARL
jgi:hypothetical protein